ncbi:siphovirus Gp157 family protein [Klebsiella pneumoniae]|uniref:siphovirus Gp157 family protein n=1 Tax=Klebsiella pneumoniae TaxID=573 RepID=UPI0027BA34B7|nr:siphovirus Gp157 family protein [Klebsiella pneumoniae]WLY04399.1 siphovirus Gp157 family protein [Klebsiella pneumoniae]
MASTTAIAIAADMSKLQALLENEDGSGLSAEMIADTMEGLELQLGDKLDAVLVHVRNLEGLAKTCDEESKRLAARKKSFEGKIANLKKYVLQCLLAAEQDTVKTAKNTFTARKGAINVVIDNVDLLPDDLVTVETVVTPDKKAIKEAIESSQAAAAQITADGGEIPEELLNPVPGAHLEIGERSLQVR